MTEPTMVSGPTSDANDPEATDMVEHEPQGAEPGKSTKVLILEDEPTLLELITEMLAQQGMDVTPTSTVQAARGQLATSTYDLFLTDLVIQGEFSGATLAKEAQQQGQAGRVVVMSGHPKQRALAGQDTSDRLRFLKKPFSYDELLDIISNDD